MSTKVCSECLRELPETMSKMYRTGKRVCVCRDCVAQKTKANRIRGREGWRALRLQDYTTKTMLEELASRGVVGKVYVDGNVVSIEDFNVMQNV